MPVPNEEHRTSNAERQRVRMTSAFYVHRRSWATEDHRQDAQKGQTSHPPNPGAPRRAVPQARPQRAKRRGGTNRTSCGPFAPRMDLGERISPSSTSDLRNALFSDEPLNDARTMLSHFFSILLVVGLGVARKLALLDFFLVALERLQRIGLEMGIGFDKLRHEIIEQSKEVIEDQDLAVTVGTGPDSNCRNGQLFRNSRGQLGRNRFEHDSE